MEWFIVLAQQATSTSLWESWFVGPGVTLAGLGFLWTLQMRQFSKFDKKLDSQQESLSSMGKDVASLTSQVSCLSEDLGNIKKKIDGLNEALNATNVDVAQMRGEFVERNRREGELSEGLVRGMRDRFGWDPYLFGPGIVLFFEDPRSGKEPRG